MNDESYNLTDMTNMTSFMNCSINKSTALLIEEIQKASYSIASHQLMPSSLNRIETISNELILKTAADITPEEVTSDEADQDVYDDHEPLLNKQSNESIQNYKKDKQQLRDEIKLAKEQKRNQKKHQQQASRDLKLKLKKESENHRRQLKIDKKQAQEPLSRKVKFDFIKDNQERASVRYKRNKGLINKIRWFDRLTGSQSCLFSINKKSNLTKFSNGVVFDEKMTAIEKAIQNNSEQVKMTQTTNSEANCYLIDEGKPMWESSDRIKNHLASDIIIYATSRKSDCQMRPSRSINFMDVNYTASIKK